MNRKEEIRELLRLSPGEVAARAGERLVVCDDLHGLHQRFADDLLSAIVDSGKAGEPLRMIAPVGPVGQYPLLAEKLNRNGISLKHCWFFFMDEYCGEDGSVVPVAHPLSFQAHARKRFFDLLDAELRPPEDQIVFPDQNNIHTLAETIDTLGGLDVCYGGIGIHGHIAFNEPEPGVSNSGPRRVTLNDFTVTINAVRARVGGNLECFPRHAYTLGMQQILQSREIRLYCRNGSEFDWANTVLRLALFGKPGDDYPVTCIRGHNYVITTDRETLRTPPNLL